MEIEVYIRSIDQSKDRFSTQIDANTPPYYLFQTHSDKLDNHLCTTIKDSLSKEDQLALSRLAIAIDVSEPDDCQVVIKDSRNAFNFLEIWSKYQIYETPLIVIGTHVFKGIPSVLELTEAIIAPDSETQN